MQPTVATQNHFDQVDRRSPVHDQRQDLVGVSSDEMADLMGSVCPLGGWRLEIATGRMLWSEDALRTHGIKPSADPISLNQVFACCHAEDAILVEQLMEAPTAGKNGDRYVMRVPNGGGGNRLIASAGRYRSVNGSELCGNYHELQDMVRSVVLTDG